MVVPERKRKATLIIIINTEEEDKKSDMTLIRNQPNSIITTWYDTTVELRMNTANQIDHSGIATLVYYSTRSWLIVVSPLLPSSLSLLLVVVAVVGVVHA